MSKSARLTDIARKSRVSPTTVSLVLREKPGIRPETRARVLNAAHELGYVTARVSRTPDERRATALRTVGLLIKVSADQVAPTNPFYSYVVAGIEEACRRRRINLLYATLPVDENNFLTEMPRLLTEAEVEGLLLVGTFLDETLQHVVEAQSAPAVLVDAYSDFPYDSVVSDNINGAQRAVTYLLENGHRHIGIVGSRPNAYPSIRERRDGYVRGLREFGVREVYFGDCALNPEEAYDAALHLYRQAPQVTAVFGCNDEVAMAAVRAAQALGKRVPQDVSVIGFDDIDLTRHVTPALTTMHVDKVGMGRMAVQLLRNRALYPDAERVTTLVHARLVERESVAPIPFPDKPS